MIYNDQVIQIEYPSLYYSWSCRGKCIDSGLCNSSEREDLQMKKSQCPKIWIVKGMCIWVDSIHIQCTHWPHMSIGWFYSPVVYNRPTTQWDTKQWRWLICGGHLIRLRCSCWAKVQQIFFTALIHSLQRKGSSCSKYCVYLLSTTHIWPGCSSYKAEYQFKRRPNLLLATNVATLFPLRIQSMCYVSEHGFWQSCTNLCISHYELIRRNIMHDTLRDQMQLDGS